MTRPSMMSVGFFSLFNFREDGHEQRAAVRKAGAMMRVLILAIKRQPISRDGTKATYCMVKAVSFEYQ